MCVFEKILAVRWEDYLSVVVIHSYNDTNTSGKYSFLCAHLNKENSENCTLVCLVYLSRLRGLPPRARGHE